LLGGGDLEVGVVHLVVLDRLVKATIKKRSSTFFKKKSAPQTILATSMESILRARCFSLV